MIKTNLNTSGLWVFTYAFWSYQIIITSTRHVFFLGLRLQHLQLIEAPHLNKNIIRKVKRQVSHITSMSNQDLISKDFQSCHDVLEAKNQHVQMSTKRCYKWTSSKMSHGSPGAHPLRSFATHPWDKRWLQTSFFLRSTIGKNIGTIFWDSINWRDGIADIYNSWIHWDNWENILIMEIHGIYSESTLCEGFRHDSISVATVRFSTLKKWHLPWPTVHFTLRSLRPSASPAMDNNG